MTQNVIDLLTQLRNDLPSGNVTLEAAIAQLQDPAPSPTFGEFLIKTEELITPQRIADLVICAVEGGSDYWCDTLILVTSAHKPTLKPWYADPMVYSSEFTLSLTTNDDEPVTKLVDRAAFQKGLQLMADNQPTDFNDFISDSEDANTADVFLQFAAFGEIIYG